MVAYSASSQNFPDFVIANSSATLATLHLNKNQGCDVDAKGRVDHDGCNVVSIKDGSEGIKTTVRIGLLAGYPVERAGYLY